MNTRHSALATLSLMSMLSLYAVTATADPATWQLWKSRLDGTTQCAQSSPGDGWVNMDGTYSNSRCRMSRRHADEFGDETPTATRSINESPTGTKRKNRMLELMAIFAAARSSQ